MVLDFGSRVSGLGSRVSGFGFEVKVFDLRVLVIPAWQCHAGAMPFTPSIRGGPAFFFFFSTLVTGPEKVVEP